MNTAALNPEKIVNEVFALYDKHGEEDYIGEPVSQLQHMWQAAALAQQEGNDEEVILAAFFHDIGHLCAGEAQAGSMDGYGNVDHEKLGADYLRERGFTERLATLVESHVIAKRYLTYKYPEYYQKLSQASKATLEFQGGRMNEIEAAEFENHPDADLFIRMRHWDDKAKESQVEAGDLKYLKALAIHHLYNNH